MDVFYYVEAAGIKVEDLPKLQHSFYSVEKKQLPYMLCTTNMLLNDISEPNIMHNIANDSEEKGMINSQDFRRWASESNAKVIIVYNMQLLGLSFGDEEVVEKLNFM